MITDHGKDTAVSSALSSCPVSNEDGQQSRNVWIPMKMSGHATCQGAKPDGSGGRWGSLSEEMMFEQRPDTACACGCLERGILAKGTGRARSLLWGRAGPLHRRHRPFLPWAWGVGTGLSGGWVTCSPGELALWLWSLSHCFSRVLQAAQPLVSDWTEVGPTGLRTPPPRSPQSLTSAGGGVVL